MYSPATTWLMNEFKNNKQTDDWNQFIYDGNMDALSRIYFHYYDMLFTYGMKHCAEKQVVEDSIQDVFINLIKFRKKISCVRNLSGYLICTFRRQLFLDHNKQKKTIITEQIPDEQFDYFKSPDQDILDKEKQEQLYTTIKQCVGNLSSKQQEILFLRFENDISYEEISDMLHISVDSCYKSVYRSVKTIRSEAGKILSKSENLILWFYSGFVSSGKFRSRSKSTGK